MNGIAEIIVIAAAFVVLFNDDYEIAKKIKTWFQNQWLSLRELAAKPRE